MLLTAVLLTGCEQEPTTLAEDEVDLRDYLLAPGGTANGTIAFRVDSTLFDPAAGGTDVRRSSQVWTLRDVDTAEDDEQLFLVAQRSGGELVGEQFWRWGLVNEGAGLVNELDGVTYLSLVAPFAAGTEWDALSYTEPGLVVPIEAEPIEVHKDWSMARIDSVGEYALPDGSVTSAVYVSHADSENLIRLRSVTEVYGRNFGLLERTVDALDSQQLEALPWEEKAEQGFRLRMRRIF